MKKLSLNRTNMGLKPKTYIWLAFAAISLNRTNMGLKHYSVISL